VILGLVLKTPPKRLVIIGLVIVFCHNLLPLIPFTEGSVIKAILTPLFSPAAIPLGGQTFIMGYPPIPWLGIMLTGFAFGRYFEKEKEERKKTFLKLGLGVLVLFTVIRFINIYGDPVPWSVQREPVFTFLSFINITKDAPSLLFCLLTLGIMILLLAVAEQFNDSIKKVTSVYGKVPLFFFIIHLYILHPIMFLIVFAQGYSSSDLLFGFNLGRPKAISGLSLGYTYLVWIAVVIMLYPLCKWYRRYKERHKENKWLKYL
jgi:uncharacterized membrane protein